MRKDENNLKTYSLSLDGVKFTCKIRLLVYYIKVYSGMGFEYVKVGSLSVRDFPEIVEVGEDKKSRLWGRLKSGDGWVPLDEAKIIRNGRE